MMADDLDPLMETLFAEARHDLDGKEFAARVMARTRGRKYRVIAGWFSVTLALAALAWLFALPLQEIAQLMAQGLTISLFDLGEGWLAWFLLPVNNIGSLLVLSVKAIRIGRKTIRNAAYT